jgi:hypothetical protein
VVAADSLRPTVVHSIDFRERTMKTQRRILLRALPAAGVALLGARAALAEPAKVNESDPDAIFLGYRHDASLVDTKKYPKYVKGSHCANCGWFSGKAGDAWGPCGALGGKLVDARGWCIVYVKKA